MKRVIFLLIAISLSALAEPENKSTSSAESAALAAARQAIDKGNAQWVDAWDKADASLIAQLIAPDGIMLGGKGKSFKGPQQILEHMKSVM